VLQTETFVSTIRVSVTGKIRKKPPSAEAGFVAYYRVSKKKGTGLSMEAQATLTASYAPILATYTEEETGKKYRLANRPQLRAALDECKRRGAVLLIAKLDRLARNVAFIAGLMESGVKFVAADMPHADAFQLHIYASMAEQEAKAISKRTVDALKAIKARIDRDGLHVSRTGRTITKLGNPHWGDSIAKARAARKTAANAALVRATIRSMHAEGKSLRAIAKALNEAGLKTPRGGAWHANTVLRELPTEQAA